MSERPLVPFWFALLSELHSHKRGFQQPSDEAIRLMFPELNPAVNEQSA